MKRETTEKLLRLFQRNDPYRTTLNYFMPIEFHGKKYCVSTSANHFIMIPETEENKIEPPTEEVVNFAAILRPLDLNIEFPISKLIHAFDSIEIIERDITTECPSCYGDGEFYHYGFSYECRYCDGKGAVSTGHKEKVKDPDARLIINEQRFKPEFIKDIISVIRELDCKKISVRYSSNMTILELDDSILCGVMSCIMASSDNPILVI